MTPEHLIFIRVAICRNACVRRIPPDGAHAIKTVTHLGLYPGVDKRSFDYTALVNGDQKGVWSVPFVSSAVLLKRQAISVILKVRDCACGVCYHTEIY
jgi:hypothetical protein